MAAAVVADVPAAIVHGRGGGIRHFRADRHQMAGDGQVQSAGRFNGDGPTGVGQALRQRDQFGEQHRLAAGDDHMAAAVGHLLDLGQNFLDRKVFAFGNPTGKRRVAVPAAQVATTGPNKNTRLAGPLPFALAREVKFCNPHVTETSKEGKWRKGASDGNTFKLAGNIRHRVCVSRFGKTF